MSFERADYQEWKRKADSRLRPPVPLRPLVQAAVAAEELLGDPRWDLVIRALEARIQEAREALDALTESLALGPEVEHAALVAAKMNIARVRGRLEALQEVQRLPREILSRGQAARDQLRSADPSSSET